MPRECVFLGEEITVPRRRYKTKQEMDPKALVQSGSCVTSNSSLVPHREREKKGNWCTSCLVRLPSRPMAVRARKLAMAALSHQTCREGCSVSLGDRATEDLARPREIIHHHNTPFNLALPRRADVETFSPARSQTGLSGDQSTLGA
jgi:hypothetical protein